MPILHFTAEQGREATLPLLTQEYSGEVAVSISEAEDCEGIKCEGRPEAVLTAEDLALYHQTHVDRGPMPPHSHMVVQGLNPETRKAFFAILKGAGGKGCDTGTATVKRWMDS
jgi:hypothetical protein